jgi:serine-type D-Ala-D-Ala carboxypeptidase/endopeptidase (penicillin-binding protein 4)
MRRFVLTWGAVMAMLAVAPAAAAASAEQTLVSKLNAGIRDIGGATSAYVADMTTDKTLYSYNAGVERLPASVEKIYTTTTALLRFGPNATLTTTVYGTGKLEGRGVWDGNLYLKGGGDPTFGSASFDSSYYGTGATVQQLVANLLKATKIRSIKGRIIGDDTYFDSLRGTPATGYGVDLPDVEGQLSALSFNRGFANADGTAAQPRPALYATQQFAAALKADGVRFPNSTPIYTGSTPKGATRLAAVQSPTMAKLIQLTNTPSDNFFAEMLLKGLGARFGGAGTTAAGAAVVKAELSSKFGIGPQLNDGSGLSRSDFTSPRQVVTVLEQMYDDSAFFNSLSISGETGTLQDLSHGTAAQGNCHGKTGTLHDVANEVGYCRARDGHELVFAILANELTDPDYVHEIEGNDMAPAIAGYDG